ncbi:replication restart helicase PriA [Robertkochia sediminum]|uniref:replication restart helicase PriA n=1 Tax=Robertkochia sediminum TaxID=2785326 RepID=UPI0019320DFB|nr:primosomal protein N' [Robertkochia sediminum]MBL7473165.1 primosomal protein N' [Robertkochia sediminum]
MSWFTDVILPIPIAHTFTYELTDEQASRLVPGCRVAVPFGKNKIYTGLVYTLHHERPSRYEAKPIDQILDAIPVVTAQQLSHWEWISSYYMCTLGEVFRAAIPPALLLESETLVMRNDAFSGDEEALKDDEWLVFEALQHQAVLKVQEVSAIIDRKNVLPVLKRLMDKGVVRVQEEVHEQYKPKLVRYVRLHDRYTTDEALAELLNALNRAPKQKTVVLTLFQLQTSGEEHITLKSLKERSGAADGAIRALIDKEVLEDYHLQQDRIVYEGETQDSKTLNKYQEQALNEIQEYFTHKEVVLLHGVTASGKTEVYVKLIEEALNRGEQVLYLLPEIALTTQLIDRLRNYFGHRVGVYHSRYNIHERVEVWNQVLEAGEKSQVVLGARSAMLLPFSKLGLVIVDEEHEPSFKQFDPAPRYHARDAAIVLGMQHKAKVLLGSATPALETWYNAKTDKYGLVSLTRRHGDVLMPDIELVDLRDKYKKKRMQGHFSDRLIEEIEEALEERKQVILFQNRRGFAPVLECQTCGHSPQCPNCDVSLTFHRHKNQLRCHYCGYHMAMQERCLACGSHETDTKGFGTEQIEGELRALFPDKHIGRMDSDTTRGKHGYEKIINKFEQKEIDILVGTQMVTKGLDFAGVGLVGVMLADTLLNFPDFRAHERTYQVLQQVSGRAGRSKDRGKVIIQTYDPLHQIMQQASMNRYEDMAGEQLNERKLFKYPPFYRLVKVTFRGRDYNKVNEAADWFSRVLRNNFIETGVQVLGPEFPPVARIRNQYHKHLIVKIPQGLHLGKVKERLKKIGNSYEAVANFRSVKLTFNVDNY